MQNPLKTGIIKAERQVIFLGEKDMTNKILETKNKIFADIMNVFLFNGEQVVKEDELTPADIESHYKADGSIHSQERDILKFYANAVIGIKSVIGVENQSDVDQFMPIRIFSYDGAEYRHQYADLKSGKIKRGYPVVTLLLYFGTEDWNYGKNLHSCLDIPERLLPFVNDYKMNFFSMKDLTKEQINMFQTDFKVIAEFFHALGNGEEYHPSSQILEYPEEVIDMISVFSKDKRFRDEYNAMSEETKQGGISMCEIYDKIQADGVAKGIEQGIAQGIAQGIEQGKKEGIAQGEELGKLKTLAGLVKDGILTLAQAAKRAETTPTDFEIKTAGMV